MSGQNGKGDKRRPGKPGAYETGWDRIFGRKKEIVVCGVCDGQGAFRVVLNSEGMPVDVGCDQCDGRGVLEL